ncbi:MAG: hypothetical protein PHQ28_03385 [Mycobacterium sp.]|nr:hypothetical protein [Mycobacterium sp.]
MSAPDVDALRAVRDAERAELNQRIAVMRQESGPTTERINQLAAEVKAARRRLSAAQGRLTRAEKTGDPEQIRIAQERLAVRSKEFDRLADANIRESQALTRAGLARLGGVLDQIGPTWAADAAVFDARYGPRLPADHPGRTTPCTI